MGRNRPGDNQGLLGALNRYYVVDISGNPNRERQIRDRFLRVAGLREATHEVLQFERYSNDGTKAIAQVALTQEEHDAVVALGYVTYIGDYDPATGRATQAVYDYLAAHPEDWGTPGTTTAAPG